MADERGVYMVVTMVFISFRDGVMFDMIPWLLRILGISLLMEKKKMKSANLLW